MDLLFVFVVLINFKWRICAYFDLCINCFEMQLFLLNYLTLEDRNVELKYKIFKILESLEYNLKKSVRFRILFKKF